MSLNVILGFLSMGGSKLKKLLEFVLIDSSSNFDKLIVSFSSSLSYLIDPRLYVDLVLFFSLRNFILGRLSES